MEPLLASAFYALLLEFGQHFTAPSARNFVDMTAGWILVLGRRTVTSVIVASGQAGERDHSIYHRFFSRAVWSWNALCVQLIQLVDALVPEGVALVAAVDDTLARKGGKHIAAAGMHHDPLLSTRSTARLHFGHVWVVLSLVVPMPWGAHVAIPVLWALHWPKKQCKRWKLAYRTKTELAVDLYATLALALPHRRIVLLGDMLYSNSTTLGNLPEGWDLVGRMPMNAALYAPVPPRQPGQKGRPRKKGPRLPSPQDVADCAAFPWETLKLRLYRKKVTLKIKVFEAIWYTGHQTEMLRIVVVRDPSGNWHDGAYYTTELDMGPTAILQTYSLRWPLEQTFRDVKQELGFEDPQNRTPKAVERTAPMALFLHALVCIWYCQFCNVDQPRFSRLAPWYRQKSQPSFADMLAALRRASWTERLSANPGFTPDLLKCLEPLLACLDRAA